jgi:hypothetical protein
MATKVEGGHDRPDAADPVRSQHCGPIPAAVDAEVETAPVVLATTMGAGALV